MELFSPATLSFALLALSGWFLETRTLKREQQDFSVGFLFPLMLAVAGQGTAAGIALVGCLALRVRSAFHAPWDLIATVLPVACSLCLQWTHGLPQNFFYRLGWGLLLLILWKAYHLVLSQALMAQIRAGKNPHRLLVEKELSMLRTTALSYSLLGTILPAELLGAAILGIPLCLALLRAAENSIHRIDSLQTVKVTESARKVRTEFAKKRMELETGAKKHKVLERLNQAFSSVDDPDRAMDALRNVVQELVGVDTVKLLKRDQESVLEPLVLRAWKESRPLRGAASPRVEERVVLEESFLVVLPLLPLGVLYVGRRLEGFSKAEASRIWFVVQRSRQHLITATREAASQKVLQEQSKISERLRAQVTLSSKLLEASQHLLAALTKEQVFQTLETVATSSVPHSAAVVLLGDDDDPVWSWGDLDPGADLDGLRSPRQKSIHKELSSTPLGKLFPTSASLVGIPFQAGRDLRGSVLFGFSSDLSSDEEQIDFLSTCSRLVGASLNALSLSKEVAEAQQKVTQAGKMSVIGQLAAGVAHELNTPLATASLAIETARSRPEKLEKRLLKAADAIDRAKHVVAQLLDHARYGEGERVLLNPCELLEQVEELSQAQLQKRRQKIVVECTSGHDRILANGNDLKQILLNLILNASDASPDSSLIEMAARTDQNKVILEVADSGSGIPDDVAPRVFETFFTTKPPGQGTGLGLSVCRQLARRHSGQISFHSRDGAGTVFVLEFPARVAEQSG